MKSILSVLAMVASSSLFAQDKMFSCVSATRSGTVYTISGCVSQGSGNLYSACLDRVEPLTITRAENSEILADYIRGAVTRTKIEKFELPADGLDYQANFEEETSLVIKSNIDSFVGKLTLDFTGGENPANRMEFDLNLGNKAQIEGRFRAVGCKFSEPQ